MSIDKTENNGFTTSNLSIYDSILAKRKLKTTKTSKQGLLIINWTLDYIEEKNFLNILGINYEINKNNLRKLNIDVLSNILNFDEFISGPEIVKDLFNKQINEIHLENILYKRNAELLYLDINFNTILEDYVIVTVNDNSDSLESQIILEKLVNENQNLIKEVNHRVKNNLQVLLSLISIQERFKKSDFLIKEYLKLSLTSMSIMHSQLFSENLTHVSTERILTDLKAKCEGLYNSQDIIFDFESKQDSEISIEKANPILLLLDELIISSINSMKTTDDKIINCVFTSDKEDFIILYKDNSSDKSKNDGLGDLLVESLISQADGIKENTELMGHDLKIKIPNIA